MESRGNCRRVQRPTQETNRDANINSVREQSATRNQGRRFAPTLWRRNRTSSTWICRSVATSVWTHLERATHANHRAQANSKRDGKRICRKVRAHLTFPEVKKMSGRVPSFMSFISPRLDKGSGEATSPARVCRTAVWKQKVVLGGYYHVMHMRKNRLDGRLGRDGTEPERTDGTAGNREETSWITASSVFIREARATPARWDKIRFGVNGKVLFFSPRHTGKGKRCCELVMAQAGKKNVGTL